jgi:hypothetical protein
VDKNNIKYLQYMASSAVNYYIEDIFSGNDIVESDNILEIDIMDTHLFAIEIDGDAFHILDDKLLCIPSQTVKFDVENKTIAVFICHPGEYQGSIDLRYFQGKARLIADIIRLPIGVTSIRATPKSLKSPEVKARLHALIKGHYYDPVKEDDDDEEELPVVPEKSYLHDDVHPMDSVSNTADSDITGTSSMTKIIKTVFDKFCHSKVSHNEYGCPSFEVEAPMKGKVIKLRRTDRTMCPSCKNVHEKNSKAELILLSNFIYYKCSESKSDEQCALEKVGVLMRSFEIPEMKCYIRDLYGKSLQYNEFSKTVDIDRQPIKHSNILYTQFADRGVKIHRDVLTDCLRAVALENPYHPVRSYLENVASTQEPVSIDNLAERYFINDVTQEGKKIPLYNLMVKKQLIGAVRRVFEPGCKHDTALVLCGAQGAQKSTFFKVLGVNWFDDSLDDVGTKDSYMTLHNSWIHEYAEIESITTKKECAAVKKFLTKSTDMFRPPFGREIETFQRQCIIVGTSNNPDILQDETGNRRFWIIPVSKKRIDIEQLRTEVHGIWCSAVRAYKNGETNWFDDEEMEQMVANNNKSFQIHDPWESAIRDWLDGKSRVKLEEVCTQALGFDLKDVNRAVQNKLGPLMRNIGWTNKVVQMGGKSTRVWEKE